MRNLSCIAACTLLIAHFTALSLKAQDRTITIRMLDSKTGKPIASSELQIFHSTQNDVVPLYIKPDAAGQLRFSAPENLKDMRAYATYSKAAWSYVACDLRKDKMPFYAIPEILSNGVVAPNYCNRKKASAAPGEFVFFVREMTFWEKMRS